MVSLFPLPTSFRFHLTMDTLAFGYILPTTGRIRDFHPLETCTARRTKKTLFSRERLNEDESLIRMLKISKDDIRLLRLYNMLPVT